MSAVSIDSRPARAKSDARLKAFVHYSALVIMALLCVGPIAVMFVTSFKTQAQTFNTGLTLDRKSVV